jgi:hypothetical protein
MGNGMKQFLKFISQFIVPIILLTYVLVPILNDRSIGEQFNQNNAQIKQFIAQLGFGVSTEEKMKSILVNTLNEDCKNVNKFVLTPDNWKLVESSKGSYNFMLYGDGGDLSVFVVEDGVGGGNITLSESDKGLTNLMLYNSGCQTIASKPKPKPAQYPTCNRVANTKDGGWAIVPGFQWQRPDNKIGYCILPNSGGEKYYFPGLR